MRSKAVPTKSLKRNERESMRSSRLFYALASFGSGVLGVFVLAAASRDVDKQIRLNDQPVTAEQMEALNRWKQRVAEKKASSNQGEQ
mmetsp:Transcript_24272/g.33934  ORF Transcript_24272/g.33934 Transcript_24272/m.33934 type:complete len:87 (+) Transcript_24272:3-263(+)